MWPPRAKVKAKLATGVCFYAGRLHRIKVLPLKTGTRVEEKKVQKLRGSALPHSSPCTQTHKHTPARAQTPTGKQCAAWLHKQNKAFQMPETLFPSSVLSFHHYHYHFYHMVCPPTRSTHTHAHAHTHTHAASSKLFVFFLYILPFSSHLIFP